MGVTGQDGVHNAVSERHRIPNGVVVGLQGQRQPVSTRGAVRIARGAPVNDAAKVSSRAREELLMSQELLHGHRW